ncbi:MAG: hypothetical protein O7D91_17595 [Planctomycetota bacterium]|nr:hypothetical protein [Planctomycetota bacterium]
MSYGDQEHEHHMAGEALSQIGPLKVSHAALLAACQWLLAEYKEEGCNTDHTGYRLAEEAISAAVSIDTDKS